jgi:hypothetical protein
MSGSYIGGHTVITVRRGPKDMERRKAHWKRKLEREQREHDARGGNPPPEATGWKERRFYRAMDCSTWRLGQAQSKSKASDQTTGARSQAQAPGHS